MTILEVSIAVCLGMIFYHVIQGILKGIKGAIWK